ncbi:Hypothetical protein PHPALM_14333 [Phytophthora palmivora]|uniref:Peptidase A2 domain-containing protein n=1 Tax=Phytophthora palmivora TaxID=4796 RepID=A0A2P4XV14_9STRA|nr:Hypothetical protein PHPALM_14333 [Phytophthora palmivora]
MDRGEFPHLTDSQFESVRKMVGIFGGDALRSLAAATPAEQVERIEAFDTYERGLIAHVQGQQAPVAESMTEEVDTDSADDPPRMTLGPSGAAMLRQRGDQEAKRMMDVIAPTMAQGSNAKLESYFKAAMSRFLKEQQGTINPINTQTFMNTTQMISTLIPPDLMEFTGKEGDEDRDRPWLNKAMPAFVRDQAPDEEKSLVFGDILTGSARNWYRQLSRTYLEEFAHQFPGSILWTRGGLGPASRSRMDLRKFDGSRWNISSKLLMTAILRIIWLYYESQMLTLWKKHFDLGSEQKHDNSELSSRSQIAASPKRTLVDRIEKQDYVVSTSQHLETMRGSKIMNKGTKIAVARRLETIVHNKIDMIALEISPGESRGYWKYHVPDKKFKQSKAMGKINNKIATLLFDSGAEVSILDATFARKVGCHIDESQTLEFEGVGRSPYKIEARTRLKITLAGSLVYFFDAWATTDEISEVDINEQITESALERPDNDLRTKIEANIGDPTMDDEVCINEGGSLFAEDVEDQMAVVPEITATTEEVKIEELQIGNAKINTREEIERLMRIIWNGSIFL